MRAILLTTLLCWTYLGYTQSNLPDLAGNYYMETKGESIISSSILNSNNFSLKSENGIKHFSVNRVMDKIAVQDIITYFLDVNVRDEDSEKTRRLELVVVENLMINRLRLELETGEEWIRLVPTSSQKLPARR